MTVENPMGIIDKVDNLVKYYTSVKDYVDKEYKDNPEAKEKIKARLRQKVVCKIDNILDTENLETHPDQKSLSNSTAFSANCLLVHNFYHQEKEYNNNLYTLSQKVSDPGHKAIIELGFVTDGNKITQKWDNMINDLNINLVTGAQISIAYAEAKAMMMCCPDIAPPPQTTAHLPEYILS